MSSNVGLSTPRGSGTSGYVQRNLSHLKPRDSGYGAPYPPVPNALNSDSSSDHFKQRKPDRQILEHDRRRAIEVQILEERERLEEENEKLQELEGKEDETKQKIENGLKTEDRDDIKKTNIRGKKVKLSEEDIEGRLDALRARLVKNLEDELAGRPPAISYAKGNRNPIDSGSGAALRERRQFKTYQVHELAEAKIEESERLRRALGIRSEGEDMGRQGNGRSWRSRGREGEQDVYGRKQMKGNSRRAE